jgi:hypothetical protein
MFDKKECERCGKEYRGSNMSSSRGKSLCLDCVKHCSVCEKKLPYERWFGQSCSVGTALFTPLALMPLAQREHLDKPWIGSGLCVECYSRKAAQEEDEEKLLREAKLAKAREILQTPTNWECGYCKTINRGKFCSNCGSPRKKQESSVNTFNKKQERSVNSVNPKTKLKKDTSPCRKCQKPTDTDELSRNEGVCDDCWDTAKMKEDGLI